MKIPIPRFVWRAWDKLGDVSNVTVYERGRIEIRRIDIFLAFVGVGGFFYYLAFYSLQMAVMATASFVFVMILCWIL